MTATFHIDDLPATRVSEAVVRALVRYDDVEPLEIPPLGESVDPIALDAMFDDESFTGEVTFRYEDYEITADADGVITVGEVASDG